MASDWAVSVFRPEACSPDIEDELHKDDPFEGVELFQICASQEEADKLADRLLVDNPGWKIQIALMPAESELTRAARAVVEEWDIRMLTKEAGSKFHKLIVDLDRALGNELGKVTPKELAIELVGANNESQVVLLEKRIRGWLRDWYPRAPELKRAEWHLDAEQVARVKRQFGHAELRW